MKNLSKLILLPILLASSAFASDSESDSDEVFLAVKSFEPNHIKGLFTNPAHDEPVVCKTCEEENCFSRQIQERLGLTVGYQNMIVSDDCVLPTFTKDYALYLAQQLNGVSTSVTFDELREQYRHQKGFYGVQQLLVSPDAMGYRVKSEFVPLISPFLNPDVYPTVLPIETVQSSQLLKLDKNVLGAILGNLSPKDLSSLALTCRQANNVTVKSRGDSRALALFRHRLLSEFHQTMEYASYSCNAVLTLIKAYRLKAERNKDWQEYLFETNILTAITIMAVQTIPEEIMDSLSQEAKEVWEKNCHFRNVITQANITPEDFNHYTRLRYRERDMNSMLESNTQGRVIEDQEGCQIM